jgi:ABC-type branched-subunit amino acid transport system substrate-binding protein
VFLRSPRRGETGRTLRSTAVLVVLAGAIVTVTSPVASASGSTLTMAVVQPFSGTTAFEGPEQLSGCLSGVKEVNDSGGVLGHKLQCTSTDTKGDPADAVPAVTKMLASTSNLVAVVGPAQEAPPTYKLISSDHIPMFSDCGCPTLDHNTTPYYFRIDPSDSLAGIAMAYWAKSHYGRNGAEVFTDGTGGETTVPSLLSEYAHLGGRFVFKQTLVLDQTSYRTEVAAMLAAHPSVLVTEMDPQTAGTYFSEVQQLDKGKFPAVEVTNLALKSAWISAVTGAIGTSLFAKNFIAIAPTTPRGPGYTYYKKLVVTLGSKIQDPKQYLTDSYAIADYDAVVLAALAMTEAKTTNPAVWHKLVMPIANGTGGATLVHSYAAGVQAIRAGKKVHYIGANGPFDFNKYQNAAGSFEVFRYSTSSHSDQEIGTITLTEMRKLTSSS